MALHQRLQFLGKGTLAALAHVVQQGHRRAVAAGQGLAQQAEQGRDPAAGSQQQHALRLRRPAQRTAGLAQLNALANAQVILQQAGQATTRLTLDGQLDAPAAIHCGQAVATRQAHAIHFTKQLHMLAWPPVAGIAIACRVSANMSSDTQRRASKRA